MQFTKNNNIKLKRDKSDKKNQMIYWKFKLYKKKQCYPIDWSVDTKKRSTRGLHTQLN